MLHFLHDHVVLFRDNIVTKGYVIPLFKRHECIRWINPGLGIPFDDENETPIPMELTSQITSALTSLIVANNKRIKGYQSLAKKTTEQEVKSLCTRYVSQSKSFLNNLSTWRSAYGGFARAEDEAGATSAWHQVRSLLGLAGERNMINQCKELEREILKKYKSAIPVIPAAALVDLQLHIKEIEKALLRLQGLSEKKETMESPRMNRVTVKMLNDQ